MNKLRLSLSALLCLFCGVSCQQQQTPAAASTPAYVYHKGYTATVLHNGKASIPSHAPKRIKRAIAAANQIVGKPYRSGGGHKNYVDNAYDCSGSVAYVLRSAGMLKKGQHPTSGDFLKWGHPGYGKWLTTYTKQGHVFLVIAGLRFDTTGSGRGIGPRWYESPRRSSGFMVRNVPGF